MANGQSRVGIGSFLEELQSTKEIGKIIGTTGTTVKQKEVGMFGVFQGFSPEQLENIERDKLGDGNASRQIDSGSDD